MDDGELSALEATRAAGPSVGANLAGQVAILELLRVQESVPQRSAAARFFGRSPLSAVTLPLYRGAVGEIEVGDSLDGLEPDWAVLHSLPVGEGAADIDHLVIGPSGVFIVNTTSHPGFAVWASQRTFIAGGIRYPYIRNMEYEMGRAERLLTVAAGHPVEVAGILAVVAPKSLVVREQHRDVAVLDSQQIVHWLTHLERVLSAEAVVQVAEAAGRSSTWHEGDGFGAALHHVRERFEKLRTEVRRARAVQLSWAAIITLAGAGSFVGVTVALLVGTLEASGR